MAVEEKSRSTGVRSWPIAMEPTAPAAPVTRIGLSGEDFGEVGLISHVGFSAPRLLMAQAVYNLSTLLAIERRPSPDHLPFCSLIDDPEDVTRFRAAAARGVQAHHARIRMGLRCPDGSG
jgi:hypothetical protein